MPNGADSALGAEAASDSKKRHLSRAPRGGGTWRVGLRDESVLRERGEEHFQPPEVGGVV